MLIRYIATFKNEVKMVGDEYGKRSCKLCLGEVCHKSTYEKEWYECMKCGTNFRIEDVPAPFDPIESPAHYVGKGMHAIDVIDAFDLNFNLGNAVKYILRAGKKDDKIQDLKKAIWYISREIEIS